MKKNTELNIDEDLLRFEKTVTDENGIALGKFVEDTIYEQICEHHTRKSLCKTLGLVKTLIGDLLTEEELEKRRIAVRKLRDIIPADHETVEAIPKEDSYLVGTVQDSIAPPPGLPNSEPFVVSTFAVMTKAGL